MDTPTPRTLSETELHMYTKWVRLGPRCHSDEIITASMPCDTSRKGSTTSSATRMMRPSSSTLWCVVAPPLQSCTLQRGTATDRLRNGR